MSTPITRRRDSRDLGVLSSSWQPAVRERLPPAVEAREGTFMKREKHRRRRSWPPLLVAALALVPVVAAAQRQHQFRETKVVKIEAGSVDRTAAARWTARCRGTLVEHCRQPQQPDQSSRRRRTRRRTCRTGAEPGQRSRRMDRCRSSRGRVPSKKSFGTTSKTRSGPNTSSHWPGARQVDRPSRSCGTAMRFASIRATCCFCLTPEPGSFTSTATASSRQHQALECRLPRPVGGQHAGR